MATDKKFVEFVIDQIEKAGTITAKSMMGEYVVYSNGKLFGLICDNRLFIKPTLGGREFINDVVEAPPYPGAKNCFLIEEKIEDRKWLSELVQISVKELPEPKPRKSKK